MSKKKTRLNVDEDEENRSSYNDVYPKDSPYTSRSGGKLIISKSTWVLFVVILNSVNIR